MAIQIQQLQSKSKTSSKEGKSEWSLTGLLQRDISFSNPYGEKFKEKFYTELSLLVQAGIDLKSTLEIMLEENAGKKTSKLIATIKNEVISGKSFSEALLQTGKFSDYEFYSLKIGEESGKLDIVLEDLRSYFKRKLEQKRSLINTFSYPVIIMFVAFGAIGFMLNFIVPMFEDVFKRFQGELPALTQYIINLSDLLSENGWKIGFFFVVLIVVMSTQKKKTWYRKYTSKLISHIPVLGDLVNRIYLARFFHSLNLLTSAKNPLLHSIQLVKKMVGYYPLEIAITTMESDILHGKSLHESMSKYAIFDRKTITLIKVGEEVNRLEMIFGQLNEQLTEDVKHRMSVMGNLMEPALIFFIGIFVAIILVAMYLPMFQLSTSVL